MNFMTCNDCICNKCLLYQSGRCKYGNCYDDKRAQEYPYDKAHPTELPRKTWNSWIKDQAYWCRGGIFYSVNNCKRFIEYKGSTVKECFKAVVQIYQDGYIACSIIESIGCERCYKEFLEKDVEE